MYLVQRDELQDVRNSLPLDIFSMVFHDNINEVVYGCYVDDAR